MRKIDRFAFTDTLANTDIATLYQAEETLPAGVKRPVLVKVLPPGGQGDKTGEFRFAAELKNLAAVGPHPSVLALYAAGVADAVPWIAFEPAAAVLAAQVTDAPADPLVVRAVLEQVAAGLSAIHARQLLHNDLKPANILQAPDGAWKIAELSLAAPPTAEITQQSDMIHYAAPELLAREFGKPSAATDLYALGHIAYELALGLRQHRHQFPAVFEPGVKPRDVNPARWMAWHCSVGSPAPAVHEVIKAFPSDLGQIIARLMGKAPAERYASAAAVVQDLRNPVVAVEVVEAETPAAPASPAGVAPATRPAGSPAAPLPRAPVVPHAPAGGGTGVRYFVRLRGRQTGPFDLATLQRQARQGLLSRLHQVSMDGVIWKPATSVEGLFGGQAASPPS